MRGCVICKLAISAVKETVGIRHRTTTKGSARLTVTSSDDGVFFETSDKGSGVWFCNHCWEKVRK